MITIAAHTILVDLEYLGQPGHIGTCILDTGEGLAVVDPGPAVTLPRLNEAIRDLGATLQDVRAVLVTHIHLDHAGGIGLLAANLPHVRVFVHEVGAPHLADPAKLLSSATRIYGEEHMTRLWGSVMPVPATMVTSVRGGEHFHFGRRRLEAATTPGHAKHHLAWLDTDTGIAFTGDVVGEQFPGAPCAVPVTPPPDIDVELMRESGRRILAWRPARLLPTHFGPVEDPESFVEEHERRLVSWSEMVRRSLTTGRSDADLAVDYAQVARAELEGVLPVSVRPFISDATLLSNWDGLARYWRRSAPR